MASLLIAFLSISTIHWCSFGEADVLNFWERWRLCWLLSDGVKMEVSKTLKALTRVQLLPRYDLDLIRSLVSKNDFKSWMKNDV